MSYGFSQGSNVLVHTPAPDAESRSSVPAVVHLLTQAETPRHGLVVTYDHAVSEIVALWRTYHDALPANLHIVDVGSSRASSPPAERADATVSTTAVAPDDLLALGRAIRERLEAWNAGARTVLCFDSITRLLERVPVETAFKFLHVAASHVRLVGVTASYALAPHAHDERTVATLQPIFDSVVEHD